MVTDKQMISTARPEMAENAGTAHPSEASGSISRQKPVFLLESSSQYSSDSAFLPHFSSAHRLAAISTGFACAMWFTGPAVAWLKTDAEVAYGVAFTIGIIGMHLVEAVVKVGRVIATRAPMAAEKAIDKALGSHLYPPQPPMP